MLQLAPAALYHALADADKLTPYNSRSNTAGNGSSSNSRGSSSPAVGGSAGVATAAAAGGSSTGYEQVWGVASALSIIMSS